MIPPYEWETHTLTLLDSVKDSRSSEYPVISLVEVFRHAAEPRRLPKDQCPAVIQSSYNGPDARLVEAQRRRGVFPVISLDIDNGNVGIDRLVELSEAFFGEVAVLIYSTSNAEPGNMKWRVMVPLRKPLPHQRWREASLALSTFFKSEGVVADPCLSKPAQPVILPNVPPERRSPVGTPIVYEFHAVFRDGADIDGPTCKEWISRTQEAVKPDARPERRGSTNGAIQSFNTKHRIADLLVKYGYQPSSVSPRHWQSPHQKSGSYATKDFGDHWVSLSGSDSAAGIGMESKSGARCGDAFDLYCHYEHSNDTAAALKALDPGRVAEFITGVHQRLESYKTVGAVLRYKLIPASEMANREPINWTIKGLIPEQGIAAVFGPSGAGKSFLVMDMAVAIAKGESWFGLRAKKTAVTIVALEGQAGIAQRVQAYRERVGTLPAGLFFVPQTLDICNPDDIAELAAAIHHYGAAGGIICIDTLNMAAPGRNENASEDMSLIIAAAKKLQELAGGLVLLVHHAGKDESRGLRGHSSLIAAVDVCIGVRLTPFGREWYVAKSKDGRGDQSHGFILLNVDLGEDDDGDRIASCVVTPDVSQRPTGTKTKPLSKYEHQAVAAFRFCTARNGSGPLHTNVWREEFYRTTTADTTAAKKKAFQRARELLVDRGALTIDGDHNTMEEASSIVAPPPGWGTGALSAVISGLQS